MLRYTVLGIILTILIVSGCLFYYFPETTVRYRLTAEFKINDKIAIGTGVLQVKYSPQPCFDVCGINAVLSGEAIPVDFGSGAGTVWLLLRPTSNTSMKRTIGGNDPAWLLPDTFGRKEASESRASYVRRIRRFKGTVKLTFDQLPMLLVLPDDHLPNWPPSKSPGVLNFATTEPQFLSAKIQRTSEPVTRGVLQRLQWLTIDNAINWPAAWGGVNPTDFWRS